MTSLSEVYTGGVGTAAGRRRQLLGASLFAVGATMAVGAIPIATTDLATVFGLGVYEARELAGILAGLGLPAGFVGIFAVLPAGRTVRAVAAIGASLAVLGVAAFAATYPSQWVTPSPILVVGTAGVYTAGTVVTFWCLFVGVATFKTRNDPGGSARLEITDEGTVRVVTEEVGGIPGIGGVGLFGTDPDGDVDTQTNRTDGDDETLVAEPDPGIPARGTPDSGGSDGAGVVDGTDAAPASDGAGATPAGRGTDVAPASDGAGTVQPSAGQSDPAAADANVQEAVQERGSPDEYCGNCQHFEYVRADGEITPYCGFHAELLEDMDACEQWQANK
jgi:hypothetical protein